MATYKKTGSKARKKQTNKEQASTTAEVFNTLDETASKSEQWVIKNQTTIFVVIALAVAVILGYMGYNKYIKAPKEREAANELAFPKTYFDQAMVSTVGVDSLLTMGVNGADGKYGFVVIASEYSGTKAGNLANYYAGISYLKLKNYEEAINYLEEFESDDELLAPVAQGAIGDAFADINQPEEALNFYLKAADLRDNMFSTPMFLFKAGNTALDIEEYDKALEIFNRIKNEYPNSEEAKNIEIYINKAKFAEK